MLFEAKRLSKIDQLKNAAKNNGFITSKTEDIPFEKDLFLVKDFKHQEYPNGYFIRVGTEKEPKGMILIILGDITRIVLECFDGEEWVWTMREKNGARLSKAKHKMFITSLNKCKIRVPDEFEKALVYTDLFW